MDEKQSVTDMTDFGTFYPRGHLVAAFPKRDVPFDFVHRYHRFAIQVLK